MPTPTTPTPSRFDELGALDPEGFWVRYHDHLAFVASGDVIRAALTAEVARLREALEQVGRIDLTGDPVDASNAARAGVLIARRALRGEA